MATNVNFYCMAFLKDGTPSVRTFANTKPIKQADQEYINKIKEQVTKMCSDAENLGSVEIITADEYDLYVNGDGTNTYIRDMNTGKPKIYIPPEPTEEEKQLSEVSNISTDTKVQADALKEAMLTALLNGDTELQEELKEEYKNLMNSSSEQMKGVIK